ncbi:hypothetical protein [Anaeromyxobacter paludicola]|uniref:Phospholipase D-like domain-containing protein n=1 Tax=Anaeromyxobacter paludicola TaxID=2918171 RepID=A0ABM7X9U2_9BACT|nr:hypothetical protein [Anaeromyxobacter paludicola]BDG08616.1 hypothetical protein AMPC_17290 [Anaeromyxobacter paludicola]
MPNVTWQEPQVLVDILGINLMADENEMSLPGNRQIAVISPWLSDVEIFLRPGPWHQQLTTGDAVGMSTLHVVLSTFCARKWEVHVAVLAYGPNPCGITKDPDQYGSERRFLRKLIRLGAQVHLVTDLHAKGVVTPLGIITGSTNITSSGMFAQSQNANYFSSAHPDYEGNRIQLLARYQGFPAIANLD